MTFGYPPRRKPPTPLPPSLEVLEQELAGTFPDRTELSATYATTAALATKASPADVASGVNLAMPGSVLSPLSIFRARIQKRNTEPVVVVAAGMSIVQGTDAGGAPYRFVNLLSDAVQGSYPKADGTASPAVRTLTEAVATPPTLPGIQFVNAGLGGTTAANFLTDTTGPQVAALDPALILIYIGVNDWHAGTSAATFKTNLSARLTQLRNDTDKPCTFVLVHGHPRTSSASTVNWDDYGVAIRELAGEHPEDTVFVDISQAFKQIGIYKGGSDLVGIMSDSVHPNGPGHAFTADLIRMSLGIPETRIVTAPVTPPPAEVVIASDTFGGGAAADLNGRVTDQALGGTVTKTWSSLAATAVAVKADGTIGRGAGAVTFFAGIPETSADERFRFTVSTLPVGSALTLDFRRASDASSSTVDAMRLNIGSVGSGAALSLISRVSGTSTTLATWGAVAANDVLEIRASGGTVSVYKNGTFVGDGAIPSALASAGWVGFSGTGSVSSWGVSQVTLAEG